MTPTDVIMGVFLLVLFGPLIGYWTVRLIERITGRDILPEFTWEE